MGIRVPVYKFMGLGNPEIDTVNLPGPSGGVLDGEYDPSWGQFIGLNFIWRFCSPLPWVDCPSAPAAAAAERT